MGNVGAKIKDGFQWLGSKMGEGWESVKAFGKKAWDKVKSVPVLGKIAEGIEKYTPIGMAATNLIKGVDAGVTGTSKLLQGDFKGAVDTGVSFGRDMLNQRNPLVEAAKKVPGLGTVVSGVEKVAENIPIAGGFSVKNIRDIGNASLNAVDALKRGDVGSALKEGGSALLGAASKGVFGKTAGNVANAVSVGKKIL